VASVLDSAGIEELGVGGLPWLVSCPQEQTPPRLTRTAEINRPRTCRAEGDEKLKMSIVNMDASLKLAVWVTRVVKSFSNISRLPIGQPTVKSQQADWAD
jgi:hypothetical protein